MGSGLGSLEGKKEVVIVFVTSYEVTFWERTLLGNPQSLASSLPAGLHDETLPEHTLCSLVDTFDTAKLRISNLYSVQRFTRVMT